MKTPLVKKFVLLSAIISTFYIVLIELKLGPVFRITSFSYFNVSTIIAKSDRVDLDRKAEPPDIFRRDDLWRLSNNSNRTDYSDKWVFQRQWAINVSRSEYMKSIKKKKRILIDGLFNLDDEERTLPCDEDGVNFSQFCQLVEDKYPLSYINFDEFDAVLSRRDWTYQWYEPKIPPRLLSFFHIQESPYTLDQGDFRPNNPILASYWRGSDIESPYYKWVPFKNSSAAPEKNYAQGKHKFAAIVVSHCPTYNDRIRYVYQLQKYISVDIYGKCGPLKCGEKCFENISKDYKFYLAFENANCRDYITEKFYYNALGHDILPVVLGAHRDDYKYAAPKNSYIHVEDFPSVKALADYLIFLDQNDNLYNSYFKWKGTGRIVNGHYDIFCRVCAFLHYADFHPLPPLEDHWPKNPYNWLQVNPCLKPGEHFWEKQ